jgi:hypothetical protein
MLFPKPFILLKQQQQHDIEHEAKNNIPLVEQSSKPEEK